MEQEIEQTPAEVIDETPELEAVDDTPAEQPKEKREYTTEEKLARVTRLQQRYQKELGIEPTVIKVESKTESKGNAGESDVEALLLEVKGIQDSDEVALFEQWKSDTGRSARNVLSNAIFQKELASLRADKAVKAATPSSTKRSGNPTGDIAAAIAKFEQTGTLPDDFETRTAVVNAIADKTDVHVPGYRRR
jgi:hypothetical protein